MPDLTDLLSDIDDAFEDLRMSGVDETRQRRASRAVVGALFEVREVFRETDEKAYWTQVNGSAGGRIAEGILVIRGRMTHGALGHIHPVVKLAVPGPKFFPSPYTYPGSNLTWVELSDMPTADKAKLVEYDKRKFYVNHIAGHMVLPTLDVARQFYRGLPTIG